MRTIVALVLVGIAFAGCKATGASASAPSQGDVAEGVGVGDRAPDFRLEGSDGKMHALADHAGKQVVVLAWFPKAFTSG